MKRLLFIPLVLFMFSCQDKQEKDCTGVDGGNAVLDDCGVCNGDDLSCQLSFRLTDRNPESSTWNQLVGPETFRGKVSAYYFPYSET